MFIFKNKRNEMSILGARKSTQKLVVKIKESEMIVKYLDLVRVEKVVKHESNGDANCYWYSCNDPLSPRKGNKESR